MRRLSLLIGLLILTACAVPAAPPDPDPRRPETPAVTQPDPVPRPELLFLRFGEIRAEEIPQDRVLVLPAAPRIIARVAHAGSVRWLVHAGSATDPFAPALQTLQPAESAPGEWTLQWKTPPAERVRLSLCVEVPADYPDSPDLIRSGGPRCVVIAAQTVQVLAPGASPYITRERALELARRVQPTAVWNARFDAEYELPGKPGTKRPTWIAEAVFTYGNRLVVWLDALTGEHLGVMEAEPPHAPDGPRPIGREKAIEAALGSIDPAYAEVSETVFREGYRILEQEYHVWVVKLVTRAEKRPAGSVVVHAYTGQVLEQTSPPSGQ